MIAYYQRFSAGHGIAFETTDSIFKCGKIGLHLISVNISGKHLCKIKNN
jgi:hypothetical protein